MSDTEDTRALVLAIVDFLRSQQTSRNDLSLENREELEVATECLETTYGLEDQPCTSRRSLLDMFNQVANPISIHDKLEAESVKIQGNEKMTQEHFEEAEADYSRAIELDRYNAIYFCNRAGARIMLNKYLEAITDCRQALLLNPDYAKAYGRMGQANMHMNRFQRAARCYRRALELEPNNETFRNNLAAAETQAANARPPPEIGSLLGLILGSLFNDISNQAGGGPGEEGAIQGSVPPPSLVIISEPDSESSEEHRHPSSEAEDAGESSASDEEVLNLTFLIPIMIAEEEQEQERQSAPPDANQQRSIFGLEHSTNQTGSGGTQRFPFTAPPPFPTFPPPRNARPDNPRFPPLARQPNVPARGPRIPPRFPMLFPPPENSPPPPPPPRRINQRDVPPTANQAKPNVTPIRNIPASRPKPPPRKAKPNKDNRETESTMQFKLPQTTNKLGANGVPMSMESNLKVDVKRSPIKHKVRQTPALNVKSNPNPLLLKDHLKNQTPQTNEPPKMDTNAKENNDAGTKNDSSFFRNLFKSDKNVNASEENHGEKDKNKFAIKEGQEQQHTVSAVAENSPQMNPNGAKNDVNGQTSDGQDTKSANVEKHQQQAGVSGEEENPQQLHPNATKNNKDGQK